MRSPNVGRCFVVLLLLSCFLSFSVSLHAATCSDVFENEINDNLGANGLDLSGVPWADNAWPPSGSTLQGGDYYFEGGNLPDNYELSVDDNEQVRIFVSGNLTIGSDAEFDSEGELLLVVQGNLVFGNDVRIEGLVYAGGSISRTSFGRGNQPEIQGALSSGGPNATDRYDVEYDSDLVDSSLLRGLCSRDIELYANGQVAGPVVVAVGDNVDFTVAAENCPTPVSVSGDSEWRDDWSVSGNSELEEEYGSSPCTRAVSWSRSFDQPGSYTVGYTSEYCNSRGWFLIWSYCDGYSEFGSDEIVIEVRDETASLNCETQDDFSGSELDPELWVTSSNGTFLPTIEDGRLRMTEAESNQATAATLQAELPGAENYMVLRFDYYAYGGSGADGLAVVLSDAELTPQPGSYGGSLGYAQRRGNVNEPGFNGGWLGIGLDEFGNFGNSNEGREGGQGFVEDSVVIRGSGSGLNGYRFLRGTDSLTPGIDSTGRFSAHTYEITIDSRTPGEALVSIRRDTGSGMTTVISSFDALAEPGQAAMPENLLLSLTGSTGGSDNIHELDNVELCALKINPVGDQVDHFEIEHSGVGLTCTPKEVTIRACDNEDCSQLFPGPVEVTLSPAGWVGGDTFTFTGSATPALRITEPATVTLGVSRSDPGTRPFSETLCDNGSGTLSAENCDMSFLDSGFDIAIPDHVSDTIVQATIAAVRKDDATQQCVPGFSNENKPVALWSDYVNPSTGTLDVFADGAALPSSQGGATSLAFDENGVATANIRYPDVGRVRLHARYDGVGEDAGLEMLGDGTFVARPDHFQLAIPGNPAATSVEDGNHFVPAGSDFDIRVSSINASGNVTPNFGQETPAESVALNASLVAPGSGDMPPLTGAFGAFGEDCSGNSASAGTACGQFQWPEVGIISITPSLASGSYLGTADVVGDEASHVGRFIPDRFNVVVSEPGEVEPYCTVSTAFAYMGQGLSWKTGLQPTLTLEALNANGNRTRNYTLGNFLRLSEAGLDPNRSPGSADVTEVDVDGNPFPVTTSLNGGSLSVLDRGRLQYRFASDDEITYSKSPQTRVPSFTPEYRIELTDFSDADGVSSPQLPVAISPVFGLDMRYGRVQMENAYGPETSTLEIPFQAEYYTPDGFVTNAADWCWTYSTADVSLDQSGLTGGSTSVTEVSGTLDEGTSEPGKGVLLEPPGAPNRGDVRATFAVPMWLTDDFDDDGTLDDPSGLATFGVYRGNDRIIYWQEVLN